MNKLKSLLGTGAAVIYFICPMSFVVLLLVFMPLVFLTQVSAMRNSGFAGPNTSLLFIGICGFVIGISLLIPPLRKIYYMLPWFYSFVKLFFVNLVILSMGITVLNYGYQVNNEMRHNLFFILMIVLVVVCRLAMCVYFKLKPVKFLGER